MSLRVQIRTNFRTSPAPGSGNFRQSLFAQRRHFKLKNSQFLQYFHPVTAPGRQGSRVISRSLKVVRQVIGCKRQCSKGARSFRGHKILKPVRSPDALFSSKKLTTFFQLSPSKHRPPTQLIVSLSDKTNKDDMVTFYFLFTLLPKQSNRQGGGSSSQVIWPGAPWCSAATAFTINVTKYSRGWQHLSRHNATAQRSSFETSSKHE